MNAGRFEKINDLTQVNSKYQKAMDLSIGKYAGRKPEQSPLQPRKDHDVVSYDHEIPKFNKGQPGYKEF